MFPQHYSLGETAAAPVPAPAPQVFEEPALYVFDKVLVANTEYLSQGLNVDGDADFILLGIAGNATSSSYQLRLKLKNGRPLSNAYVNAANLVGTAQFPVALPREIQFDASGQIGLDIKDTSGSSNTVQLIFIGVKRFKR